MGTIDMSRVQPKYVPKEVKDMQITDLEFNISFLNLFNLISD